jgi:hypothetical protein
MEAGSPVVLIASCALAEGRRTPMARLGSRRPPSQQEMQTFLSRWQNVLLHISSAWGEPGAPTWHGPVVMARRTNWRQHRPGSPPGTVHAINGAIALDDRPPAP